MISFMKNKLGPSNWEDMGLNAVITLKWTFLMTEMCHHDSSGVDAGAHARKWSIIFLSTIIILQRCMNPFLFRHEPITCLLRIFFTSFQPLSNCELMASYFISFSLCGLPLDIDKIYQQKVPSGTDTSHEPTPSTAKGKMALQVGDRNCCYSKGETKACHCCHVWLA